MNKKEPCLLPWIEMHIDTLGSLKTCCAQSDYLEVNNAKPLSSVFNGDQFQAIRSQFLSGQIPKVCETCIKADKNGLSYKTVKSKEWSSYASEVLALENQKNKFPIRFLDLRFGNLCNFACRTCDSNSSSRWEGINSSVGRKVSSAQGVAKNILLEQIFSILDEVEEIYFAGGEPLLSEEHYLVLEEIIRRKKTSIKITYNTNLSLLRAHGRDVIKLWEKLDQVIVYPSIDSIGARGEYIRSGLKWNQFEENFIKIKRYVGNLQGVLSAYNVFSIADLVLWAHQQGVALGIFPAYHPVEISAAVLPEAIRHAAANNLRAIQVRNPLSAYQQSQITLAINFLQNNYTPEHTSKFMRFNQSLDYFHKTDFFQVFPEHQGWLKTELAGAQSRKSSG